MRLYHKNARPLPPLPLPSPPPPPLPSSSHAVIKANLALPAPKTPAATPSPVSIFNRLGHLVHLQRYLLLSVPSPLTYRPPPPPPLQCTLPFYPPLIHPETTSPSTPFRPLISLFPPSSPILLLLPYPSLSSPRVGEV